METALHLFNEKNISITAVTKGVCGSVRIADLLSKQPIHSIGDTHIQNIEGMKNARIDTKYMLLRAPMQHEIENVVVMTDYGLNSEISTIRRINDISEKYDKIYNIILMIELGDRREGILPDEVENYISQILGMDNIHLAGIGTNLVCLNGIKPTNQNMQKFSDLARFIINKYALNLEIVSGGNSANFQWVNESNDIGLINHLRIGEMILLGTDPITQSRITGLEDNTCTLIAEVVESKCKNSKAEGIPIYTAFGDVPEIKDEGEMNRAILAIGLQDLDIKGCNPVNNSIRIIGATSDHMVIASKNRILEIGETVQFNLTYRALLRLMISPHVAKKYT